MGRTRRQLIKYRFSHMLKAADNVYRYYIEAVALDQGLRPELDNYREDIINHVEALHEYAQKLINM